MSRRDALEVLHDPLAQKLLHAAIPARLAYTGTDGGPRVVAIGFHWDGEHIVMATATTAPKVAALRADPRVAITVDTNEQPPDVLLVRGTVAVEVVDGVPDEYLEGARKGVPAERWDDFERQVRATYDQMARIVLTPEWAKLLDFEARFPDFLQRLLAEQEGRGSADVGEPGGDRRPVVVSSDTKMSTLTHVRPAGGRAAHVPPRPERGAAALDE
jgi:hypothetical protein